MPKALIIDDERAIRSAIREILEYEKIEVDEAEDGLQGVVKVKGATVYPSEVEAVLQAIPGVQRAFVTAITQQGVVSVGAAVVLDTTHSGTHALDVAQLHNAARQRLSAFKVPTHWATINSVQDIPYTANGKLDKAALQQLLQSDVAIAYP